MRDSLINQKARQMANFRGQPKKDTGFDHPDFAMPERLSEQGQKAYKVVMDFLKEKGLSFTGGCHVFQNPAEWADDYGTSSQLIVVYEGCDFRHIFSMDAAYERARPGMDCYALYEEMQARLGEIGMYFEECTRWYCAIYPS